jgi:hypothetical protein
MWGMRVHVCYGCRLASSAGGGYGSWLAGSAGGGVSGKGSLPTRHHTCLPTYPCA